jgi:hypothetical protein
MNEDAETVHAEHVPIGTVAGETVHVVFGQSIAETLRAALRLLGRAERVIGLPDCLSVGPIDPPDPALRQDWAERVLRADIGLRDGGELIDVATPWAAATAPGVAPVFWSCLTSPMEHACFLAFAARMRDRRFDLVDATDLDFTTAHGVARPGSLGWMRAQDIVAAGLYARRRPVSSEEREAAARAWAALRRESAPFRIVRDGRLVSAPLTHYDAYLVAQAGADWEIAARLIGRVHTDLHFGEARRGEGNGADVLFGRMLALGDAGALAITGPGPGMRDHRVRRAAAVGMGAE